MSDSNRLGKWVLVIVLVVLSLTLLYPPSEKLKGGIDLVGGTSLLYEIDSTGLDRQQQRNLSSRVMSILKERVDPKGQLNLEWRPVGNTRLEIRMPRPPKEALARRDVYNRAIEAIKSKNLRRYDVESALSASEPERSKLIEKLKRGIDARAPLIEAVVAAFHEHAAVQASGDASQSAASTEKYEKAMADLLATSMPVNRLTDILGLAAGSRREAELKKLRAEFPSYDAGDEKDPNGKLLTKAVAAYDKWAKHKADLEDPSDLKRRLKGAGVLEFRILANRDPASPSFTQAVTDPALRQPISRYTDQLKQYGPRPKAGDRYGWFPVEDVVKFMHLDNISDFEAQKTNPSQPIVEEYAGQYFVLAHTDPGYGLLRSKGKRAWSLREAFPNRDPLTGENVVSFGLDPRGGARFGELTGNNIGRSLCIMLDNKAMSHAVIQSRITTRGQISGQFTAQKAQDLVRIMEAGSLPARLIDTPLMENTIGPSLGETNRTKGMWAAVVGTVSVLVFMVFYYGLWAGGMADLALILNLLFVLSIMALLEATFTLPGIAGLILTVGMAVDANVLIFERIREERDRGVIFKRALNAGYDKAFSTIMDANLTTLLTCVILGFVGSEEVKGFAITLGIGISTSMFTALFVTRLVFNTMIAKKWLTGLSMRRIIGVPNVDWLALRRTFWPISVVASAAGIALFVGYSGEKPETIYDIEFLGGTSLQIDLKPGHKMTDDEMAEAITGDTKGKLTAVSWLRQAGEALKKAQASEGEVPGQFTLTSPDLTGEQLGVLMHATLEKRLVRDGTRYEGHEAVFDSRPGALTLASFKGAIAAAVERTQQAADRLSGGRIQSVGQPDKDHGQSYEIVTVETNRELVQAAVLAALGNKLSVQRALAFSVVRDDRLTLEPFFVVEGEDEYLSDVIGGDAHFDVRRFRGGVAVVVALDPTEEPISIAEFSKRMREVGLQPEFEEFRTRESAIRPLGSGTKLENGETGYKRFAVLAIDEALLYDEDPGQWREALARPQVALVEAALGQEKSLSKVIQFAAPIAEQTRNRAMVAIVLALAAIVSYLWLRFGTKEYGLAAIVALVHDVSVTLGLVACTHFVAGTTVGRALGLENALRINLPMIAAILTVIGYSLNDTIVVFDRIRENKGRVNALNPRIINSSLNQTLSRTLLTSITTFLVVAVLYAFGGAGVHGFAFALLIGVVVGTYSSLGVATPLLYQRRVLHSVVAVIVALGAIGIVFAATSRPTLRATLAGLAVVGCAAVLIRFQRDAAYGSAGRPATA